MTKDEWKETLMDKMEECGYYDSVYDIVIDMCASVLAMRDGAMEQFEKEGCQYLTPFISDRGQVNMKKNPLLTIAQEFQRDAYDYLAALGLTPMERKELYQCDTGMNALEEALLKMNAEKS